MTRTEAIKLVGRFIDEELPQAEWYQKIASVVKAVIFYGSRAKEINRPDSDIDILLIVPLEVEKKYTAGEYFFQYEGWEINIVLRSIERLRSIAEEGIDVSEAEIFRKSEIIWESNDEVRGLVEKIKSIQ